MDRAVRGSIGCLILSRLMPTPRSATHVRFAIVGDIHVNKDSAGQLRSFFAQASEAADALLLCGDLTDYGTVEEARVLVEELSVVKVPIDFVSEEEGLLRLESHAYRINFEGRIHEQEGRIAGTFAQGSMEVPLVLRRAGGKS